MKKEIKIGEKTVMMSASAFTPFSYKNIFGRDIIKDIQTMQKQAKDEKTLDAEIVCMMSWIMAREADKEILPFEEWCMQFELFELYQAFNQVVELWGLVNQQKSTPRKK